MTVHDEKSGARDVADEAIAWHVRLHSGEATQSDRTAHEAWLAESAAHRAAYERAARAWDRLDFMAEGVLARFEDELTGSVAAPRKWWLRPAALASAAAVLILLAAALLVDLNRGAPQSESRMVLASFVGAGTEKTLSDGSIVHLDAASRLEISYAGDARRVKLAGGAALFDVARAPERAFIVEAGDVRVRVLGTMFEVNRSEARLTVGVARGAVDVRRGEGSGHRLSAGEMLVWRTGEDAPRTFAIPPEQVGAWRDGRLVYQSARVDAVIADLNRHFAKKTELADQEIGAMTFTGVLKISDHARTTAQLAMLLGLEAHDIGEKVELARPDTQP